MILTCPQCAARYQVEDGRVGPEGRTVRCANCGSSWRAMPDLSLDTPTPRDAPPTGENATPAASPARAWREARETRRETVKAGVSGVAWAAAGVMVVALLAAAVVFRAAVVRAAPPTASVFATIGLPVNIAGVEFDSLSAQPVLRDGQALVVVTGVMRNVGERPVTPTGVRVALLDPRDRELAVTVARSTGGAIPAGETRGFTVVVENPPAGATNVVAQLTDAPPTRAPATGAPRLRAAAE